MPDETCDDLKGISIGFKALKLAIMCKYDDNESIIRANRAIRMLQSHETTRHMEYKLVAMERGKPVYRT